MSDKKTIEVSEELFEKLSEDKGKSTWEDHLSRMYERAYGIEGFRAVKLDDYQNMEGPGEEIGRIHAAPSATIELLFRRAEGAPAGIGSFDNVDPGEELILELLEGRLADDW